jgi:hypothetical protein
MICTLTARRIKPGQSDEFLKQFEASADDMPPEILDRWQSVYACRDVDDEDVILTFGMFDGTLEELRDIMDGSERDKQLASIAPMVDQVLLDGSFQVIKEFVGESSRA